jgi:antitoxin (DNA-binding transcriptional repressor) of toxin-antitoxin stability system
VVITRHSRPVAALVAIKDFLRLREYDRLADARFEARRGEEGDGSEAIALENLIDSLESAEAGGAHLEGGQVKFGHISTEQLARDVVTQYIESAEFLYRAQHYVNELIASASNHRKAELTAHEAQALKRALLAELNAHGLITHEYA